MFIVKIGGTNGSGKTTLVRSIINKLQMSPNVSSGKPLYYTGTPPKNLRGYFTRVVVLGSYENICGGMDTISSKEEIRALVHSFVDYGDTLSKDLIIFEGLITGKTYGYLGELSERDGQFGKWLYVLLNTPYDVCVSNIISRRNARGNASSFDPEKTVLPTYRACHSTIERAASKGHPHLYLEYGETEDMINNLLSKVASCIKT